MYAIHDPGILLKPSLPSTRVILSLFHAAGHLALWVGLYCAGAAVCFAQVSGQSASAAVLWVAGLTAMSVYLLDRVKLADTWLDPADRAAHPERFGFLGIRSKLVRKFALFLGLIAMFVAARIHPSAISFVPLAGVGVLAYAGLPRRLRRSGPSGHTARRPRRVKDVLLVKNIAVAACISGFVSALVLLDEAVPGQYIAITRIESRDALTLVSAAVFVFGIVLADAIMCDIDDAGADREHGTATIPGEFGTKIAWLAAGGLHVAAGIVVLLVASDAASAYARQVWVGLALASFLLLAVFRPKKLRDLIDARLAILAIIASIVLAL